MSLHPLAQAQSVLLRAAPRVAALPHVTSLLSAYLDWSPLVSPARAATSGCVRLLQRVVVQLNDPIEQVNTFSLALEAAITTDDLKMTKAVHRLHPGALDAHSLTLAMAHGSLELVQWVIAHRCDRLCCRVKVDGLCRSCVDKAVEALGDKDVFRIVTWLISERLLVIQGSSRAGLIYGGLSLAALHVLLKSCELVRWCDDRGLLTPVMIDKLVFESVSLANRESLGIVSYFLQRRSYFLQRRYAPQDPDKFVPAMVQAACERDQEELVELLLATICRPYRQYFTYEAPRTGGRKVLKWDRAFGEALARKYRYDDDRVTPDLISVVVDSRHVDAWKWLVEELKVMTLRPTPPTGASEQEVLDKITWLDTTKNENWTTMTMDMAAENGHLRVVQWLDENRTEGCTVQAMNMAAENGHLHVVQWLHKNRTEGCTMRAMNMAAAYGHLSLVQWFHENRDEGNVGVAMVYAAANGHLDVLQWLAKQNGCVRCTQKALLANGMAYASMASNPRPRVLYALQWLDRHQEGDVAAGCVGRCAFLRSIWLTTNLAASALGSGDMLLAEYLHRHHPDLFMWDSYSEYTASVLVFGGHLAPLVWLHERYPTSSVWQALVREANTLERTATVEWISLNVAAAAGS